MNSYLVLDYADRPHKRVCRKIIGRLARSFATCLGSKLDYIGMGSLFYEDFKEFHEGGFIDEMVSIEYIGDAQGSVDALKYRRFMLNRPYESIRLMPVLVGEAVEALPFDKACLVWFDYDSELTRGKVDNLANVIRKAQASSMLVCSTSTKTAYYYMAIGSCRDLDMATIHASFDDMVGPEETGIWERLTAVNFSQLMRDAAEPYYQRLVAERNRVEHRNFQLRKVGRIKHRDTSWMVDDIWLLVDADKVDVGLVERKVLGHADAGSHVIDMPVLTEREKRIIASRLDDDPAALAEDLALEEGHVRKILRYWDDCQA